jgi:non-homologous end joining protein Ku
MSPKIMQVRVRMPVTFHRKLMRDADRSGQTLNAEILRRLEKSYETDDTLKVVSNQIEALQKRFDPEEVKRVYSELLHELLKDRKP